MHELLANPDQLLELEPDELAVRVLRDLQTKELHRHHYMNSVSNTHYMNSISNAHRNAFGSPKLEKVLQAVAEAWAWLECEQLLVPHPDIKGQSFISRRGRRFLKNADVANLKSIRLLPVGVLDPVLAGTVHAPYVARVTRVRGLILGRARAPSLPILEQHFPARLARLHLPRTQ